MHKSAPLMLSMVLLVVACGEPNSTPAQTSSNPMATPAARLVATPLPTAQPTNEVTPQVTAKPTPKPTTKPTPKPTVKPSAASGSQNNYSTNNQQASDDQRMQAQCADCGRIESITPRPTQSSGIGAVLGGAVGGVLGHQVGGGKGKQVATVLGAVGGALAGNEIEKQQRGSKIDDLVVRMDNGGTRNASLPAGHGLAPGQRVRLVGENVQPL